MCNGLPKKKIDLIDDIKLVSGIFMAARVDDLSENDEKRHKKMN